MRKRPQMSLSNLLKILSQSSLMTLFRISKYSLSLSPKRFPSSPSPSLPYLISALHFLVMASSKRDLYHLHFELEEEYTPLKRRNKIGVHSVAADMESMRRDGRKNLDLWIDGRISPLDPVTKSSLAFYNSTSLMRFIGDGLRGLLGYTLNLQVDQELHGLERQALQKKNDSLQQELGILKSNSKASKHSLGRQGASKPSLGSERDAKHYKTLKTSKEKVVVAAKG